VFLRFFQFKILIFFDVLKNTAKYYDRPRAAVRTLCHFAQTIPRRGDLTAAAPAVS